MPGMDKAVIGRIIRLPVITATTSAAMRSLRTVLICMLMLALPAQGMAALSMQLCALTQPGSATAQVDAQMVAHHLGTLVTAQAAGASTHNEHHTSDNASHALADFDKSLCSLCVFCVAAVILNSVNGCDAPQQASEPSLARLEQFVGFIGEPLERPPRSFLV